MLALSSASVARRGLVNTIPSSELCPTIMESLWSNFPSRRSTPGSLGTNVPSTTGPNVKVPYGEDRATTTRFKRASVGKLTFFRADTEVILLPMRVWA